jgi:hypothetical protein
MASLVLASQQLMELFTPMQPWLEQAAQLASEVSSSSPNFFPSISIAV